LDLALTGEQPQQAELSSIKVGQLALVLVSSRPDTSLRAALAEDYVYVDWGSAFDQLHTRRLGEMKGIIYTDQGSVALDFLRCSGGSAYLPESVLDTEKSLFKVARAPVFTRPIYACHRANGGDSVSMRAVLSLLPEVLPQ
jgi:LysR family transcriptional regulator, flagellar master operon regulator